MLTAQSEELTGVEWGMGGRGVLSPAVRSGLPLGNLSHQPEC